LIADGKKVPLGDRRYLLSPQDLAGLEVLPDLIRAGVSSLKIEGRLKSPEYVASITRVYREALDREMAAADEKAQSANDRTAARYELEMSFSRGLYTGWFRGINNRELAHARFGTKRGVYLGQVERVSGETVELALAAPLKPGDGVVFDAGKPEQREQGGRVYAVENRGNASLLRFGHGDIDFRQVAAGQLLWKTNDPELDRRVRQSFEGDKIRFQRGVALEVHGRVGEPLVIIADDGNGHVVKRESALPLVEAVNQPLSEERLRDQLGRLGGTPYSLTALSNFLEGRVMIPVSELNRLRREWVEALDQLRVAPKRWTLRERTADESTLSVSKTALHDAAPEMILVLRNLNQLEPALAAADVQTFYCEFENPKHYRDAVKLFREHSGAASASSSTRSIWVAPPRIFKPGEEWILRQVLSAEADGYLVRNYDHLAAFTGYRMRGDFSLNVANPLTAEYFISHYHLERVTASYDLNVAQLEALLESSPPEWFDLTLHQHMPMFHMEHCVFCAFLSEGKDYRDCGRPCDKHDVRIRDRVGADLPLKADAGCRNTVYNNRAQTGAEYLDRLRARGARHFRIEFINESPDEVSRTITSYRRLFRGEISGAELWRELKLINQLGVTRGQLENGPALIHRKG